MKGITELGLSLEDANKLAQKLKCAECNADLVLAWGGYFGINDFIIRCVENAEHDGLAKEYTSSMYTDGEKNICEYELRGLTDKMVQEGKIDKDTAGKLVPYTKIQVMTEEQARDIVNLLWKNAPEVEKEKAILLCASLNLNPLQKHIYLIPFKDNWVTVMSIQASRTLASRKGKYRALPLGFNDTLPSPRALTEQEAKQIYGRDWKIDRLYVGIRLQDVKTGAEATAYKFWAPDARTGEQPYGVDKGNSQFNMASIRAEREALSKLYGDDNIPPEVMMMDSRYLPEVEDFIEGEIVNKETGEITPASEPQNNENSGQKEQGGTTTSEAPENKEPAPQEPPAEPVKEQELPKILIVCPDHGIAWKLDKYHKKWHSYKAGDGTQVPCKLAAFIEQDLKSCGDQADAIKNKVVEIYNKDRSQASYWSQIPEDDRWLLLQKVKAEFGIQSSMIN